jgi:outer membrane protein OmpA-like peptidoglycan-associated protein
MKDLKLAFLSTVAALCVGITGAQAGDNIATPHYTAYYDDYSQYLTTAQTIELRNYLNYEMRQPCQNYRPMPNGFYRDGCAIKYIYPRVAEQETYVQPSEKRQVLASYTVNFAFDSSAIQPSADVVLSQIAREITQYKPNEVIVYGFADTSGSSDYNIALSDRRAAKVSSVLDGRGVPNHIIGEQVFGETNLAVQTNDGVKLRANRRVVIEFLK